MQPCKYRDTLFLPGAATRISQESVSQARCVQRPLDPIQPSTQKISQQKCLELTFVIVRAGAMGQKLYAAGLLRPASSARKNLRYC